MYLALAASFFVCLAPQQTDTTISVASGTRLVVDNFGGAIVVRSWTRSDVRVTADHEKQERLDIRSGGATMTVKATARYGPPQSVEITITVPEWMSVTLEGVNTEITVNGVRGDVVAQTVNGAIDVRGPARSVIAGSVQGSVQIDGARGRVQCSSVNEDVTVSNVTGEVVADATNGAITLSGIDAAVVEATTVNGDISLDGTFKDGGRYRLATHNGDVTVYVPASTNATVSVATFSGDFESAFPVQLTETRKGRRFTFTIGSGSARVELESFQGTIQLLRAGAARRRN